MKMNRQLTGWIAALFCLVGIGHAAAQPSSGQETQQATITASASVTAVQVAEPFQLVIECVAPVGTNVSFPAVIEKLGEFDVIEHRDAFDIPLKSDSNRRSWTRTMTLESIVTGDLTLPAIEVQISDGTGRKRLASRPLQIKVLSVLEDRPDPNNFRDVKPLVDVEIETEPASSFAWVGWTIGGLAGGLFFAAAVVALVRHKRFITPSQWAHQEFDQLEQSLSTQQRDTAADSGFVSSQWSAIIREFLEMQLDISAPHQTSNELLAAVKDGGEIDAETVNQIGKLFTLADRAKYAGLELSQTQLRDAILDGRKLVNQIARLD